MTVAAGPLGSIRRLDDVPSPLVDPTDLAGLDQGLEVGVILFLICVVFAFTYKRWIMRDE